MVFQDRWSLIASGWSLEAGFSVTISNADTILIKVSVNFVSFAGEIRSITVSECDVIICAI